MKKITPKKRGTETLAKKKGGEQDQPRLLKKKVFIKREPLNAKDVERKEDKSSLDPIHEEMEHQD